MAAFAINEKFPLELQVRQRPKTLIFGQRAFFAGIKRNKAFLQKIGSKFSIGIATALEIYVTGFLIFRRRIRNTIVRPFACRHSSRRVCERFSVFNVISGTVFRSSVVRTFFFARE